MVISAYPIRLLSSALLEMVEQKYEKSSTTWSMKSSMEMLEVLLMSWPMMLFLFSLIVKPNTLHAWAKKLMSRWSSSSEWAGRADMSARSISSMTTCRTLVLEGCWTRVEKMPSLLCMYIFWRYVAFIDLTRALELVSRKGLFILLQKTECPFKLLRIITSIYEDTQGIVQCNGSFSDPFQSRAEWREAVVWAEFLIRLSSKLLLFMRGYEYL